MDILAFASFVVLVIAWLVAPTKPAAALSTKEVRATA